MGGEIKDGTKEFRLASPPVVKKSENVELSFEDKDGRERKEERVFELRLLHRGERLRGETSIVGERCCGVEVVENDARPDVWGRRDMPDGEGRKGRTTSVSHALVVAAEVGNVDADLPLLTPDPPVDPVLEAEAIGPLESMLLLGRPSVENEPVSLRDPM